MPWAFRTGAATRARKPRRKAAPSNLVLPRSAAEACRLRACSPRRRTRCRTRKLTSSDQATRVVSMAPRTPLPLNDEAHLPWRLRELRTAPPEEVEEHNPARRQEVRNQTVVEVDAVREPVHENDRRFRPRVVPDVDPVLVPPHKRLLVGQRSFGMEVHLTTQLNHLGAISSRPFYLLRPRVRL